MHTLHLDATPQSDGKTLTFLANSGQQMTNGYTVDIPSLRIPVKGNLVTLDRLDGQPDLPLLLDHDPSVEKQAGLVTRLWQTDNGLMAQAELNDTPSGQLVQTLAQEGQLTNSFSITIDYDSEPQNGVIANAELVEISVVYRGADSKAEFQSINQRNIMADANNSQQDKTLQNTLTPDDAKTLTQAISDATDAINGAIAKLGDTADTLAGNNSDDAPADDDSDSNAPADQSKSEPPQPNQRENARPITVNNFRVPGVAKTSDRPTWLSSDQAMDEYARTLLRYGDHRDFNGFKQAWQKTILSNARDSFVSISPQDVTKLVPTAVLQTIDDAYNNADPIWPLLNHTGADRLTVGMNGNDLKAADGSGRAHGYPVASYGTQKAEEKITLQTRELEPDYVYKYVTLNKGDIRRTQTPGALVRYVISELGNRIFQTIGLSVLFGEFTDMQSFKPVTGENDADGYSTTVTLGAKDDLLSSLSKAAAKVKASGAQVLVCSSETEAELATSAYDNAKNFLPLTRSNLASVLGVSQIITPEWWDVTEDAIAKAIIFVPSQYGVVGDSSVESFTNFALETNTNQFLQEIYTGGGLMARKSAVVVKPAATQGA